jgi:ppGpp synthetase/RelA/SpoT-type nucleotidyltranferase
MQIPNNFLEIYESNYTKIQKCSQRIVKNIEILLRNRGIKHIDQLTERAKSVERFRLKAEKKTDDGIFKYKKPLSEIQDQIGIRIVTFYLSDVEKIAKIIFDNYEHIEAVDKHPDSYDEFSYVGKHFILFVPDEEKTWREDEFMPSFFELQIKTMFQHAWAESEHDLNYKTNNELSVEDKRLIAFSAAQAWGADHVFEQLSEKYLSTEKLKTV